MSRPSMMPSRRDLDRVSALNNSPGGGLRAIQAANGYTAPAAEVVVVRKPRTVKTKRAVTAKLKPVPPAPVAPPVPVHDPQAARARRFADRLGFDQDTAAALARRHEFGVLPERETGQ